MKTFKHFLSEGMFGKVGKTAERFKTKVVRSTFPNKLRVGIAALQSTGKSMYYRDQGDTKRQENIKKWRNEILSGKRKLRG